MARKRRNVDDTPARSLEQLLNECGLDTRVSNSPEFADCVDFGMSHSFAIEGVKP